MGRWERLAMTVIVTAALVVAACLVVAGPAEPATRTVTALPGDTVLSLVLREAPGTDPARAAAMVEQLNSVTAGPLSPGAELRIPARWAR